MVRREKLLRGGVSGIGLVGSLLVFLGGRLVLFWAL